MTQSTSHQQGPPSSPHLKGAGQQRQTQLPPPDPIEESRASLVEHLTELRKRLVISLIAVGVGFGISWTWVNEIFLLLVRPLSLAAPDNPEVAEIHFRGLADPFFVLLKTAGFSGVVLAVPVILWQIWQFIAPGLYANERRVALPFVFVGTLFFLLGGTFCYFIILPFGYGALLRFGQEVATPELMMQEYLGLTTKLLLAFGIIFEMPLVTTMLARLGIVTHTMMLQVWRYALVACFIIGAMLTPPDVISQLLLAGPMMVLYFISVGCAYVFGKKPEEAPEG